VMIPMTLLPNREPRLPAKAATARRAVMTRRRRSQDPPLGLLTRVLVEQTHCIAP
jgi:hypothetical protein